MSKDRVKKYSFSPFVQRFFKLQRLEILRYPAQHELVIFQKIISDYIDNELSKVSHPHKRNVIQEEKPSPEYETVFFSAEDATGLKEAKLYRI